jgi:hypothetical protein
MSLSRFWSPTSQSPKELYSRLEGLNVFFFPRNQEELAGTDGLESMRAPFMNSRVTVVLFRDRWGNTPWTGVEAQAIKDHCLQTQLRSSAEGESCVESLHSSWQTVARRGVGVVSILAQTHLRRCADWRLSDIDCLAAILR